MADGTHFHQLDESIKLLNETATMQAERLESLQSIVTEQQRSLSELVLRLTTMDGRLEQVLQLPLQQTQQRPGTFSASSSSASPRTPLLIQANPIQNHTICLDFPRFDGVYPLGWISMAGHFFDYHHTADDQRLLVSSFHMDGKALLWFQEMRRNGQFSSRSAFTQALEVHFGFSEIDGHEGALPELVQVSFVSKNQMSLDTPSNTSTQTDLLISSAHPNLLPTAAPLTPVPIAPPSQFLLTPSAMRLRRDNSVCSVCEKVAPGHCCKPTPFQILLAGDTMLNFLHQQQCLSEFLGSVFDPGKEIQAGCYSFLQRNLEDRDLSYENGAIFSLATCL